MTATKNKIKIVRITTVAGSLSTLLKGQLAYMNQFYDVLGVAQDSKGLKEVREQEGIRTFEISMTRKITPVKDLKALWKLYRFFKNEKPHIVHTHTPKAGTLGLLAAFLARVPNRLHTIAGLPLMEATGLKRVVLDWVEKTTYACATKVYPNSIGLATFVKEGKYTKEGKLHVIGQGSSNGIDLNHFDPKLYSKEDNDILRKKLEIAPDERILLFLGRLVADKGIHELIEAFTLVSEEFPNTTLMLVGEYEKDLDPLKLTTEHIMDNHPKIKNIGFAKDVRPYFALSELFVFPSYREGFPNVVMQAGAMGLPSIVSDINGCNEIIIPNINGSIVPPKDTIQLQKAIITYLKNTDEKYKPEICRKMINDRYNQEMIWNLLHDEYKRCLGTI